MDRNQAIEIIKRATVYTDEEREALELLVPELADGEDEKTRKEIIAFIEWSLERGSVTTEQRIASQSWLDYLERQKENPDRPVLIEKAKTEKQVVLLTESDGDENIFWDTMSSEDAVSLLEKGLKFFGKQKEQKPYTSETMNEKGDFDGGFTGMMEGKTEDEEDKDAHTRMDLVQYITEWKNRAADRMYISTMDGDVEKCEEMLDWVERHKDLPVIEKEPQFNDSGDVMFGNPDDYKMDAMDYIEEGEKRGIKKVIENPEKYGLQKSMNYVLCNNTMDKIQVYIANNFIADEVVKTDVKSIVKAMEEGVRLGIDAQKDASPFASCAKCSEYTRGYEDGKKLGLSQGYNNAMATMKDISELKAEPAEWTEEDEKMAKFYDDDYNNRIGNMPMKEVVEMRLKFKDWIINRIKYIRPPHKPICPHYTEGYGCDISPEKKCDTCICD